MTDKEERETWELEHRLWDFLGYLVNERGYVLARWHPEGECKQCGRRHLLDQMMDTTTFSERRNLPRDFLNLESWEASEKKADELLAEIRAKREVSKP